MKVTCDDVEYELDFDLNAICDVEDETKLNLFASLGERLSMNLFRAVIYALLKPKQPEITLVQVGRLIRPDNIGIWSGAFKQLFEI